MKAINLTNKNLLLDFKDSKFSKSNKAVLKKFEKQTGGQKALVHLKVTTI